VSNKLTYLLILRTGRATYDQHHSISIRDVLSLV